MDPSWAGLLPSVRGPISLASWQGLAVMVRQTQLLNGAMQDIDPGAERPPPSLPLAPPSRAALSQDGAGTASGPARGRAGWGPRPLPAPA